MVKAGLTGRARDVKAWLIKATRGPSPIYDSSVVRSPVA